MEKLSQIGNQARRNAIMTRHLIISYFPCHGAIQSAVDNGVVQRCGLGSTTLTQATRAIVNNVSNTYQLYLKYNLLKPICGATIVAVKQ